MPMQGTDSGSGPLIASPLRIQFIQPLRCAGFCTIFSFDVFSTPFPGVPLWPVLCPSPLVSLFCPFCTFCLLCSVLPILPRFFHVLSPLPWCPLSARFVPQLALLSPLCPFLHFFACCAPFAHFAPICPVLPRFAVLPPHFTPVLPCCRPVFPRFSPFCHRRQQAATAFFAGGNRQRQHGNRAAPGGGGEMKTPQTGHPSPLPPRCRNGVDFD